MKEIIIYTDGACFGNPGPGGYAAVLIYGTKRKEISGGFRLTTNNRMEILAAIEALKALKPGEKHKINLYSDSRLLVDSVTKGWVFKWKQNNWKRNKKDKALNSDLWEILLIELEKHHVSFHWTKGHAGNPENERCDVLSKSSAEGNDLLIDLNYENGINN